VFFFFTLCRLFKIFDMKLDWRTPLAVILWFYAGCFILIGAAGLVALIVSLFY